MLRSTKRSRLRVLPAPLSALVFAAWRSGAAAKGVALALANWIRHPLRLNGRGGGHQPSRAKGAREGLVHMIAIVLFAVAAQSAIFGLARSSSDPSAGPPIPWRWVTPIQDQLP